MAQQPADLPNTHGGVRGIINDNATDAETRLAKADKARTGFISLNDLTTQTTPITLSAASGWVALTNDGLGDYTRTDYLPEGITTAIYSANQFDFSELTLGDMINIRTDIVVTTTVPNQVVQTRMRAAIGTPIEFSMPFSSAQYKSSGTYSISRFNGIYMGDTETKDNPAVLEIASDGNLSVQVIVWYLQFMLRGEAS
jgi:hypothetical protein